ncbi:helix-turn-helix domain-containing protein [Paenibacillus sp. S150]|uniref:helix-turn-helix domain-containing protein n=1 Tax=Paenibacillus sp. S150 TaxID=2749826 RepID=UPI001C55EBAC|nr:helix-turn-helix domain-containing protein [Paenibacillus sp. S150]MBW4085820.1 helix-turn-helix domain-containing protein [Paenibacillus sp. S150]
MRFAKWPGQQHLFVRLMIPYISFMIVALCLGGLFYKMTYDVVKDEVTGSNMQLLEQVKETMDIRFSEINTIALQLLNDPMVQSFARVSNPFSNTTTYKVLETQKNLYSYNTSNNFVLDYYLIFKNSNLALSSNSIYELPSFYKYVLSSSGTDYDTWRGDLFSTYRNREVMASGSAQYQGKPYDMLTYVQSLGYPGYIQGALVILVDNRKLKSLLSGVDVSDGGWVSIIDNEGRVVSSLSGDGTVPNLEPSAYPAASGIIEASGRTNDMMVTYTKSSYNNWSYVVAQPPHVVLGKVISIKKITYFVALAFLMVGMVLAYLFATRSGKPLVQIFSTLTDRSSGLSLRRPKDMYGFIQNSLSALIDNNAALQGEITRQAPLLWESFYERLLKGEFLSLDEINTLLKHQHIEIDGAAYAIGILHFRGGDRGINADALRKLDIERVLIKEALRLTLGDGLYVHDVAEDKIAILFIDPAGDSIVFRQKIEQAIAETAAEIGERLALGLYFAIGGFRTSLLDVSGSYEEARQSLSSITYEEIVQTAWFYDLPSENSLFYFPGEVENRLSNYTKAGESEELRRLLDSLFRENFQERHLPLAMQQLFCYEMISCLVKLQEQLMLQYPEKVGSLLQQLSITENLREVYRGAAEIFLSMSAEADQRKKSRNVKLIDSILAYIQEQFGEANLSLDAVADHMNISKGYMSQFFKEQTGTNFSDYLENLRMNEAKALLANTGLPIRDIAEQVGYHSTNTFCRAFKRGNGLSATAFRDSATG